MPERIFKGLIILACLGFFGWLVYDHVSITKELGDAKADLIGWQTKYNAAAQAQKESEQTIFQLRQNAAEFMQALERWKARYDEIDRKNVASQRRIRRLETENTEIRDILRSRVPDAVWIELFPKNPGS